MASSSKFIKPYAGNPQIGNLETPLNSSGVSQAFISNLPAYRQGLSAQRRGLEVGMAHGYLLYGPFALLGPLRDSEVPAIAGLIGAVGLVLILTVCLSLYSGANISSDVSRNTLPYTPPEGLSTDEGWSEFAGSFLIGGIGGAAFACALTANLPLLSSLVAGAQ
ncbi:MAG: photosystem I reaction center subunit XI [Cyanobacteria bacterium P01_A01_bin.116]